MSDELKDFTVTPTLTFEPLQEEAPVAEVKKKNRQSRKWMKVFFLPKSEKW